MTGAEKIGRLEGMIDGLTKALDRNTASAERLVERMASAEAVASGHTQDIKRVETAVADLRRDLPCLAPGSGSCSKEDGPSLTIPLSPAIAFVRRNAGAFISCAAAVVACLTAFGKTILTAIFPHAQP